MRVRITVDTVNYVRKCLRIMQLLEVAAQPEDLNIAGFRFHGLQGKLSASRAKTR
jgi:hypothetical protein